MTSGRRRVRDLFSGVTLVIGGLTWLLFRFDATDTGWFRFSSTTADTDHWASKLVEAGAVPAAIYADLYERDTLGRTRLRGQ